MGWSAVKSGEILALAAQFFDVFATVERNLSVQQNLVAGNLAVFVLRAYLPARRSEVAGAAIAGRERRLHAV